MHELECYRTVEINKLTPEAIQQLHLYGVDVSAISEPVSVELPRVKFADGSEHLVSKHRFSLEKKVWTCRARCRR